MFKVRIYINTNIKGLKADKGLYGYVIEYITKSGQIVTRHGTGEEKTVTKNQLNLTALKRALEALTKPCEIETSLESEFVKNAIKNGWITEWEENGWKNKKGEEITAASEWGAVHELLKIHKISFKEDNPYKEWILREMRKKSENDI